MTSGSFNKMRRMLCVLMLAPAMAPAQADAPDAGSLIRRLARPAPASVTFTEVRFSPLLREPLIVSGELEYSGPSSFDRRVERPYREATQIRGDSVRVEREGEQTRSFALKRAPELRGLLTGFAGLLSGDAEALEREFRIDVAGDDARWKLSLTPLDKRARARFEAIEIDGSRNEPRCFSMLSANGGASVMLLGETASRAIPTQVTLEELAQICEEAATP